jgi:polyferredoxin
VPRIAATTLPRRQRVSIDRPHSGQPLGMWIIVLEMLAALAVLLFIVWWTMFAGRRRGERRDEHDAQ